MTDRSSGNEELFAPLPCYDVDITGHIRLARLLSPWPVSGLLSDGPPLSSLDPFSVFPPSNLSDDGYPQFDYIHLFHGSDQKGSANGRVIYGIRR